VDLLSFSIHPVFFPLLKSIRSILIILLAKRGIRINIYDFERRIHRQNSHFSSSSQTILLLRSLSTSRIINHPISSAYRSSPLRFLYTRARWFWPDRNQASYREPGPGHHNSRFFLLFPMKSLSGFSFPPSTVIINELHDWTILVRFVRTHTHTLTQYLYKTESLWEWISH